MPTPFDGDVGMGGRGGGHSPPSSRKTRPLAAVRSSRGRPPLPIDVPRVRVKAELAGAEEERSTPFMVLGVDLSSYGETEQLVFCALGVICFHLVQGFLQELVVIEVFDRKFSNLITLLNFAGLATMAMVTRRLHGHSRREIPLRYHLFMSGCTTTSVGLTFFSMRWLDYPTKTLFKSSRMLLTMLAGVALLGKKYGPWQWGSAVMIIAGLVLFTCGDAVVSSDFDVCGVGLICGALAGEVGKAMTQERVLKRFPKAETTELIFYDNLFSGVFTLGITLVTGELRAGVTYISTSAAYSPAMTITAIACMAYMGFNGTSIVTAVVGNFGAVTAAMITTLRKASSILLSFIIFPKPVSSLHVVGSVVFMTGLVLNKMKKRASGHRAADGKALSPYPTQNHMEDDIDDREWKRRSAGRDSGVSMV